MASARHSKAVSSRKLAIELGVSYSYLLKIENGTRSATKEILRGYERVLDLGPGYFPAEVSAIEGARPVTRRPGIRTDLLETTFQFRENGSLLVSVHRRITVLRGQLDHIVMFYVLADIAFNLRQVSGGRFYSMADPDRGVQHLLLIFNRALRAGETHECDLAVEYGYEETGSRLVVKQPDDGIRRLHYRVFVEDTVRDLEVACHSGVLMYRDIDLAMQNPMPLNSAGFADCVFPKLENDLAYGISWRTVAGSHRVP